MSIAAVVLTYNEVPNIDRCLRSLQWCDDVVIVDSGSTDGTIETANTHRARVYEHRVDGRFLISEQRNWALANTDLNSGWILFVDADEVIPEALAKEIQRRCGREPYDAYRLAPKYMFQGQWMKRSMRFPSWHDRLLRRNAGKFAGGVWESFDAIQRIANLREPYLHYGNSKGVREWLNRHLRYAEWEAQSTTRYLATHDPTSFRTRRRLPSRILAARLWRFRPAIRFITMYFLRGGFLDGSKALRFCLRYLFYEQLILELTAESHRNSRELEL